MQRHRASLLLASFACLVSLPAPVLLAQDANVTTRTRGGRTQTIEDFRITQDDLRGVQARKGPQRMSFKAEDVVEVKWLRAPGEYSRGLSSYNDGDYDKAVAAFREALENAARHEWLPVYANWYLGESLRRTGDTEGALAAYQALVKANPIARQAPEAYVAIAELHLRGGSSGAGPARQALQSLQSLVTREKLPERYSLLADLGLARVEARVGDADQASQMLGRLASRDRDHPDIANLARLEIGNVLLRQKKYKEAESHFQGIMESAAATDPDIVAGASNGLGDCQFAQGRYDQAMYTYSRVYALFIDRNNQARRVAHALLKGGQAFRLQAGKESDPEKKKLLLKRGREALRRLIRDFPGSAAAEEAKTLL